LEQKLTAEILDTEKFQIITLKLVNFDLHHLADSTSDCSHHHTGRSMSGNEKVLDTEQEPQQ
jgi:hypothetical protein